MILKHGCFALLACLALALTGCSAESHTAMEAPAGTGQKTLLDVRSPEEYAAGHLPGAINLPVGEVESRAPQVVPDKSKAVYVHCQSGSRSARAKAILDKLGYPAVTDLGSYKNAQRVMRGSK